MDGGDEIFQEIDRLEQEIKQVQEMQTKIQEETEQEIKQEMLQEELKMERRPQLAAVAENKESDSHIDDRSRTMPSRYDRENVV